MFSTRLENTTGELGQLVSHACYPIDVCKSLLLGICSCSKSCSAHMHRDMDDLRRWTRARHRFYIATTPHMLATNVRSLVQWVCGSRIQARYAGVDRHWYHTVSHRDRISSGGNTPWVHAGKDRRGWWKGILGLLHSCCFDYLRSVTYLRWEFCCRWFTLRLFSSHLSWV